MSSILSKRLKLVFKEKRPGTSAEAEPGMPSSHAQNLSFLALFFTMELNLPVAVNWTVLLIAVYLCALRVISGHHTVPQVLVGVLIGTILAILFSSIFSAYMYPIISSLLRPFSLTTRRVGFALLSLGLIRLFHVINGAWKRSFLKIDEVNRIRKDQQRRGRERGGGARTRTGE